MTLFYLLLIVCGIVASPRNITSRTCRYKDSGMYWNFQSEYVFEQYILKSCFSDMNICMNTTCASVGTGTFQCRFLTLTKSMEILSGQYVGGMRVFIMGKNSTRDFQMISNFYFFLDRCHLTDCKGVIALAKITKVYFNGKSISFSWNRRDSIYNKFDPFITVQNLKTNITKNVTGLDYKVNDPCGVYNVCVVTTWTACQNNVTKISRSADCTNVRGDYKLSELPFDCVFNKGKQILKLSVINHQKLFSVPYTYRYNITGDKNKHIFNYNTTNNKESVGLRSHLPDDTNKVRVSGSACISCRCSESVPKVCRTMKEENENSMLYALGIVGSILFVFVFLMVGYFIWRRRRNQEDIDPIKPKGSDQKDKEINDMIKPPVKYQEIYDVSDKPHKYICIGDGLLSKDVEKNEAVENLQSHRYNFITT